MLTRPWGVSKEWMREKTLKLCKRGDLALDPTGYRITIHLLIERIVK